MKKQKFLINVDQRFREFYIICSAMSKNYRFVYLDKQRLLTNICIAKGQLNSEWIYEVIVSPKMPYLTVHYTVVGLSTRMAFLNIDQPL